MTKLEEIIERASRPWGMDKPATLYQDRQDLLEILDERPFTISEIESQLVNLGETIPKDYQAPDGRDLWKVVTALCKWLRKG